MNFQAVLGGGVAIVLAVVAGSIWWVQGTGTPAEAASTVSGEILPIPPIPPRIAEGEEYDRCLQLLNTDAPGARAFADAWVATGGGDGAAHCLALAHIALGAPETGADLMERMAGSSRAQPAARASIFGQAGQAWLMAGDTVRAYGSATMALTLTPDDADLLIDRSIASATLGRYHDAIDDLTRALDLDPRRPDALVFRGAAWRYLDQLGLAQDDVDRALAQNPDSADALLERGIIRQRNNDRAGARDDWERAAALSPDSATADLAQQNLALLEAGPDQR